MHCYKQNAKLSWSLTRLKQPEEPSPRAENSSQIFSTAIPVSPFTSVTDAGIKKGCAVEAGPHPDVSQLFEPSLETAAVCANYNSMNYASGSKPQECFQDCSSFSLFQTFCRPLLFCC